MVTNDSPAIVFVSDIRSQRRYLSKYSYKLFQLLTIDEWKNRSNEFKFWVQHTLKHCGQRGKVTEGGMVMLKNLKSWLVGRVKTVVPGIDGSPGAVSVRTSQGVFMRPIMSVCPLPPISRWPVSRLSDLF